MKIRRVISVYDINSEKLIYEISIDHIPIVVLRRILNVDKNDLDVYKVYSISNEQLSDFTNYSLELSELRLENTELYVECFQA